MELILKSQKPDDTNDLINAVIIRTTFKEPHKNLVDITVANAIEHLTSHSYKIKSMSTTEDWNGNAQETIRLLFPNNTQIDLTITTPKVIS